jgi:hypothetical protein
MSTTDKRGNETEPKIERKIDPRSKADIGKDHFGTHAEPSVHQENMQKHGNLDGSKKGYDKKQD